MFKLILYTELHAIMNVTYLLLDALMSVNPVEFLKAMIKSYKHYSHGSFITAIYSYYLH